MTVEGSSTRSMRDRLVRFLSRESRAADEKIAETLSLPIEERIEQGDCLGGLKLLGDDPRGRILLACAENRSRFRAGDKLLLGAGDDPLVGVPVDYESYDAVRRVIVVRRDRFAEGFEARPAASGPLALDRRASDFSAVALDAVDTVYAGGDARSRRIRGILDRTAERSVDGDEEELAEAAAGGLSLDASQREAFVASWAKRDFHLVQGPPGSGKTWLLACLITSWARRGERILVAAFTHRAVNNVLAECVRIDPRARTVKVGGEAQAEDLPGAIERVSGARYLKPPAAGSGQIVGASTHALKNLWGGEPFDRVVFDEASQISLPYAICGMLVGTRYLFVGDHRQLGPIVQGEHEDEIARLSIFEHLLGLGRGGAEEGDVRYGATMLETTYRMNAGINSFPSRNFYRGRLKPSKACENRLFKAVPGGPLDAVFDPALPAVMATIAHEGHRMRCEAEARCVTELLVDLLQRQGVPASAIAVVTPYRAQIQLISNMLAEAIPGAAADYPVIDSVERIQGQQREVVIVSLVCSEPEHAAREAPFFFSPNRLNVALTRARTKLVIVASPHLFEALPRDLENLVFVSRFVRLYRELPKVDISSRYLGSR